MTRELSFLDSRLVIFFQTFFAFQYRGFSKMGVRLVVAVTDRDWFDHLQQLPNLSEINFWSPSPRSFQALREGELFLFKLHAPYNVIVGGGVFALANNMPITLAWEAFGEANGARDLSEMRTRVLRYRRIEDQKTSIDIGCRILTQPFFLPQSQWFAPPASWSPNIVSFRGYSTDDPEGFALWDKIMALRDPTKISTSQNEFSEPLARYGEPALIRPRLGQGAFRLLVTDLYGRRCAVTGERTLPALEAAHIRPYAAGGEHVGTNGILFRRDIHSLFDAGYVTVTKDYHFEVSRRIKEEFENGRDYYALNGKSVAVPERVDLRPNPAALDWHNRDRFLG